MPIEKTTSFTTLVLTNAWNACILDRQVPVASVCKKERRAFTIANHLGRYPELDAVVGCTFTYSHALSLAETPFMSSIK
jgi:hypothetical protein